MHFCAFILPLYSIRSHSRITKIVLTLKSIRPNIDFCESSFIKKADRPNQHILAFETKSLRHIPTASCMAKKTNEWTLDKAGFARDTTQLY